LKNSDKELTPPKQGQIVQKEQEPTEIDKEVEEFVKEAPPEVRELLKEAPPEVRKTFMGFMMRTSMGRSFPHPLYPLFDKFTSQHVDTFLKYNEEENIRDFKFASQSRWFHLVYVILGLLFLLFLIIYLMPSNKDLLINLIAILMALAGGFGFGYGYRAMK
jgi:hypothetical protein